MARYHDLAFNNRLYSGRRRFLTQYVERYPLPDPGSDGARTIIRTVRRLVNLARDLRPTDNLESQLETQVQSAFGVAALA
jgi:hypothetical protein